MCATGEVSSLLKFFVFFFNFVFWCAGVTFVVVGAWAFSENYKFTSSSSSDTPKYSNVFDVVFDLTILIIVLGLIIFIIAFAGCIGALRENICLLKFFCYVVGALLFVELILAVLAFVFTREIKAKSTEVFQMEGLVRYRDADDLRNLIDWTQKTFRCCGVGLNGYRDWSYNAYFNCTDDNPSMERCGVPYSCCVRPNDIAEYIINTQCGHGTQKLSPAQAQDVIYTSGCLEQMLQLAGQNLYIVGGVALGVAVVQILGIFLARSLANQIEDEKGN